MVTIAFCESRGWKKASLCVLCSAPYCHRLSGPARETERWVWQNDSRTLPHSPIVAELGVMNLVRLSARRRTVTKKTQNEASLIFLKGVQKMLNIKIAYKMSYNKIWFFLNLQLLLLWKSIVFTFFKSFIFLFENKRNNRMKKRKLKLIWVLQSKTEQLLNE